MRELLIVAVLMLVAGDNAVAGDNDSGDHVPAPTKPAQPVPAQPSPMSPLQRVEQLPASLFTYPVLRWHGWAEVGADLPKHQTCQPRPESTLEKQWKLGRMYADGNGVPRDDVCAFDYFTQIANAHPDEAPGTPQARFVANAFVSLGHYYLTGIPNSKITADPARARDMFGYAATYFGDADAQYELGRLYLSGALGDTHQAARWFQLAAINGHCRAEVALGDMLFQGQAVPRQAARGLMWLTLGRDCAGPDATWVEPFYDSAFKRASDAERTMALVYLVNWLKGRRE
jgi:hypothetical protein